MERRRRGGGERRRGGGERRRGGGQDITAESQCLL